SADIATNATNIATHTTDIATNSANIATNVTNIATNTTDITTNATDIAAHVAADGDLDSTNELQTLSLAGNDLTISSGNTVTLTPLIDSNLAKDDLIQDPETRTYDMNTQDLGFVNGNVGIGNSTPNSTLQISGSISAPIRTTAVDTVLGPNDFTLITTEKDLIITLPSANICLGRIYVIKNFGGGDNQTSINYLKANGDPDDKIDNDKITWLQSDGTNWHLITRL
ncbi:MAG: hypothetical protein OER83_07000, partial [Flavobacteriaceae bacterium]|nr:hypothetical protein [Flavobacteriaceae bacterium]